MVLDGLLSRDQVVGRVVRVDQLADAISTLANHWLAHQHTAPDGSVGWYRILDRSDRVGNFATAQALDALTASGTRVPELEAVVRGLVQRQLPDGGWAFVSTVHDEAVVDATSWVLMALSPYRHEPTLDVLALPAVLDRAAETLQNAVRPEGGWGIVAGGTFRAYSTALAVRALCVAGRDRSSAVQRGIRRLVENVNPSTGAWRDSSGRDSIPVTAEVIRALRAPASSRQLHALATDRAARWLLSIAESSQLWSSGPVATSVEEIEVDTAPGLRRVEFGFAPRTAAITALLGSGRPLEPAVVHAIADVLAGQQVSDWSRVAGAGRHGLTSWMLHDTCIATSAFRDGLPAPAGEVWANRRRVVVHSAGESAVVRFVRRRWVGLTLLASSVGLVVLLRLGGVVGSVGPATLAFVATTVALGLVTNLASAYLLGGRR